jgi:excisionase family DNA binding protein
MGRAEVERLRAQQRADTRLAVSPKEAAALLGLSLSRTRQLIAEQALTSFLDGRSRRVLLASIYDRLVATVAAAHRIDSAMPKAGGFHGTRPKPGGPRRSRALSGVFDIGEY